MLADQDVHLGPVPVIGREEHDLVEERVDVALAGLPGHLGVDSGVLVPEVVRERASQLPDQGSPGRPDGLHQQGVLDLHAALAVPSVENSGSRPALAQPMQNGDANQTQKRDDRRLQSPSSQLRVARTPWATDRDRRSFKDVRGLRVALGVEEPD